MNGAAVYLKPNVVIEPLFNQWYAWSYLIAPATAPMYIANQHLKIMQSFVAAPQVHVSALKNAAMLGGPFINYNAGRVPEIKELMQRTAAENARLLEFAAAVKELDQLLEAEAQGFSLEPLYRRVPEMLRGYVELVYDLNNHASIRFLEGLLYGSPIYNAAAQSVSLSLVESDDRSFVFSTPRLEQEGQLHVRVPFDHEGLAELYRMQETPRPLGQAAEALGVGAEVSEVFSRLFTPEPPRRRPPFAGPGVRVRYFGHACVLIETRAVGILVDPVISYPYASGGARYTYEDLPDTIDYVVITHNHQDHFMFETLLRLRHRIRHVIVPKNNGGFLADPSMKMLLRRLGFKNVQEIDEMESVEVEGGSITGIPFLGEHADLNVRTKTAHLVQLEGRTVYLGADSNNIEPRLYDHVAAMCPRVDALFLGMECDGAPMSWLYGPLVTKPVGRKMDQSRRFDGSDFAKGIEIVNRLNPEQVYIYAMGQEPWLTFLTSIQYTCESRPIVESDKLVNECRGRGLTAERLFGHKELLLGAS